MPVEDAVERFVEAHPDALQRLADLARSDGGGGGRRPRRPHSGRQAAARACETEAALAR